MNLINRMIHGIAISVFIILAIMLVPLSISKFLNIPIYINEEFTSYFNDFKKDNDRYKAGANFYKLTTTFSNSVPSGVAAFCRPITNSVVVSSKVWDRLSNSGRKALLYHEWAHCTLRRDHTEDLLIPSSYCPKSIMYPYIDNVERCFKDLEDEYVEELFTNPYNYEKFSRGI